LGCTGIRNATLVSWKHGYSNTSLRDLLKATPAQLHCAKRQLGGRPQGLLRPRPSVPIVRMIPLAGADFPGGVVIVLRQVLDEVSFRTSLIFMGHGTEHKTQLYQFLKRLCATLEQSLISFLFSFIVFPFYPTQIFKGVLGTQNASRFSAISRRLNQKSDQDFLHAIILSDARPLLRNQLHDQISFCHHPQFCQFAG
jgi:hypothetical protein